MPTIQPLHPPLPALNPTEMFPQRPRYPLIIFTNRVSHGYRLWGLIGRGGFERGFGLELSEGDGVVEVRVGEVLVEEPARRRGVVAGGYVLVFVASVNQKMHLQVQRVMWPLRWFADGG